MKVILIAWFIVDGDAAGTAVTAEFDNLDSCEQAATALELEGAKGKGKNVTWRYICTPK
jgi:hypothetical protein